MFGLMRVSKHDKIMQDVIHDLVLRHEETIDALADGIFLAGDDFTKKRIADALAKNGHMPKFHTLWRAQR